MQQEKKGPGRPKRTDKDNAKASAAEKGTKPGERRKTYIVNTELSDKIEAIAEKEDVSLKEVVNDAFSDKVEKFERKNGPIKISNKKTAKK